ncbi:MAG: ArsB/NhaD family transporter [Gammaproteobacteria bacterium]|jgi:Na+/H+ antiporter NhaD/arsenite permease-like protein|nr:ArsB/NhaD family transporter [Gammaproteobacteria bacterium]
METVSHSVTTGMWVAGSVLVVAYVLIFSEVIHRTLAGVIGAVTMIIAGMYVGFYSQADAIAAIDANTMFLLTGMMTLVVMLKPTGGFEYLAIRMAKLSKGSPKLLLIYVSTVVTVISLFLDNVTTVLVFAPLTVVIARLLGINPVPYLMAEALLSDTGGVATLVGDPPNVMIGSAANIDFNRFLFHMGPIIFVAWVATLLLMLLLFRTDLSSKIDGILDLDETQVLKEPKTLMAVSASILVVILLFFIHHHYHLFPGFVAWIGVAVALVLVRPDPEELLKGLDWSVLLFFAGLFIIVGGVEGSGLLDLLGQQLAEIAQDPENLLLTALVIMWVSAFISAVVDNIPFTVTMIPIIAHLETQGVDIMPLWWALALGVGLGGNGSHIGSTANVICVAEAERIGIAEYRITPMYWLRKGTPVMLSTLMISSLLLIAFFDYYRG